MKFLITFLEEQGIKDFDTEYFSIKSENGKKEKEFFVQEDECFVCEAGESLWNSNENGIEFTLFQATRETEIPESIRFLVPVQDFSIKEVHQPTRIINILNKGQVLFSIEENYIF